MRGIILLSTGLVTLALLVASGQGQEKDKIKGFLPPGWKDLGLTAAQKEKIYTILGQYKVKQDALEEQKKALKIEEKGELSKVLTDDQKELLRKITLGESTKKEVEKDKK